MFICYLKDSFMVMCTMFCWICFADGKVSEEGHANCNADKYDIALNKLEEKLQCSKRKYTEALGKLEKKIQHRKECRKAVSPGAGISSFPVPVRNSLPRPPSSLRVVATSDVHENKTEEQPPPSGSPVNQHSCHEQDVHSETNSAVGVSFDSNISTESSSTKNIKTQSAFSAQDLHSANGTSNGKDDMCSERKSLQGDPCKDERDVANKETCSDESNSDSNSQSYKECELPSERISSDLIKVFQCNFCNTYYLYYESYQEHKKKCLTCSKCNLTFPSIFELYKHITSKAHKEYFSFLEVYKWTQSQLRLRISRNEVYENDVKKLTSLELASEEKVLSVSVTDSSIEQNLSLSDQKQDNVGTSVAACSNLVLSAQEQNISLHTSESMSEKQTPSKHGEETGSPTPSKETTKSEENNTEIVCMKVTKSTNCSGGPSNGNIDTNISESVSKESSTDNTQQKHFSQILPQRDKGDKQLKEKKSTYRKPSPGKFLNSEASKSKNVLTKTPQNITKDCKSHQNENNKTLEKISKGSKPPKKCFKFQPLQSDSSSLQVDGRIVTSNSPNKKETQDTSQKQQSNSKEPHRKQSSSRILKSKNTSKNLLQGTEVSSTSTLENVTPREKHVSSAGSKIGYLSESLIVSSSVDKKIYNSNSANSSSIQSCNQKNANSKIQKSGVTGSQTKYPLKRSHSFEDSAPKALKLLMKRVGVASNLVVVSRKTDVVPENCPGCSNRIDITTAVYNTKTYRVSFWCPACSCDVVFSIDA